MPTTEIILEPHHEQMLLEESGIDPQVVAERGYRSIYSKAELRERGFGANQQIPRGLLIPIYGVDGSLKTYQYRPDGPRMNKQGKLVKYETRAGSVMTLDVPKRVRSRLGNLSVPIFFTEGAKKADAAASRGLCCVALLGVWNFRGRNDTGGMIALADFEHIALNGRKVYIVFDSDVVEKREVYLAMQRFKAFLESRDATVLIIYLPSGDGGKKTGLDDFLAADHSVDDLFRLASPTLHEPPHPERLYEVDDTGTYFCRIRNGEFERIKLANFSARIQREIIEDDGAEQKRVLELGAHVGSSTRTIRVRAEDFSSMYWVLGSLGANANIEPGYNISGRLRHAIQATSEPIPQAKVYTHTGWIKHNGQSVYLHAGGGLGVHGAVEGIETGLEEPMSRFLLPRPPLENELVQAIRNSIEVFQYLPPHIGLPLLAATYRAPLGQCDFTVFLSGQTGVGKSEIAALVQQHFGSSMDSRHLPGSWSSTANATEGIAFLAKDTVFTIDDFNPQGSTHDVQRAHRDADRVIRAAANGSARQRMRADTSLRPSKSPRSLLLVTGEDYPRGESLGARILHIEVKRDDVPWDGLAVHQHRANDGVFAHAMSAYICFLAGKHESINIRRESSEIRSTITARHHRTATIAADLAVGLRWFLHFAAEVGAISNAEATRIWDSGWEAILALTALQKAYQVDNDPAIRFISLVQAVLNNGMAHVVSRTGEQPGEAGAWGWWQLRDGGLAGSIAPQGRRIGYLHGTDLYLEPASTYELIQRLCQHQGLLPGQRTLWERLWEGGVLRSRDVQRGVYTVRRTLCEQRCNFLHFDAQLLSSNGQDLTIQTGRLAHITVQNTPDPDIGLPSESLMANTEPHQNARERYRI